MSMGGFEATSKWKSDILLSSYKAEDAKKAEVQYSTATNIALSVAGVATVVFIAIHVAAIAILIPSLAVTYLMYDAKNESKIQASMYTKISQEFEKRSRDNFIQLIDAYAERNQLDLNRLETLHSVAIMSDEELQKPRI